MPSINLLPWREELRRKRKKDFMLALLGAVLAGGLIAYAYKLTLQGSTARQNARNAILKAEIAALDGQIDEILGLEKQTERLLARMRIIDRLQRSRPDSVHLFDELVNTLPEGVRLTAVRQSDARIEITGASQSSAGVSALIRNLEGSEWLAEPALDVVETVDSGATRNATFTIVARQRSRSGESEALPP